MFPANLCSCLARNTLFLNVHKRRTPKHVPIRLFFKWNSLKPKPKKSINSEETKSKPLTGIDDPNFSDYLMRSIFDFNLMKKGFKTFLVECKKFYDEEFSDFGVRRAVNREIVDERNKIKMLHKFETPEDLENCRVITDSSFLKGFSSASFKLTENETAIFSGNICTDTPKTGDVRLAGYANLQFPKKRKAFFRVEKQDWTKFNHIVLKIRGDGRTYMVLVHLPHYFEEVSYSQFASPLYTRGGPYWQIVKIPFSHFFITKKGRFVERKYDGGLLTSDVVNLSITTGGFEGPFKLEIDYIGLEEKLIYYNESPYERYAPNR